MERDALLDEFMTRRGDLATDLLKYISAETSVADGIETWLQEHLAFVENWQRVIEDVQRIDSALDFPVFATNLKRILQLIRPVGNLRNNGAKWLAHVIKPKWRKQLIPFIIRCDRGSD